MKAWIKGTISLDASALPTATLATLQNSLTLARNTFSPEGDLAARFYLEEGGWLHLPRGFWFQDHMGVLREAEVQDGRSDGHPLPAGTRAHVTFGIPPFPSDQPEFVRQIEQGARANGHGGLCEAPTRSGKTLCSLEAAARLGGSTLILVDSGLLEGQWKRDVRDHLRVPCGTIRTNRFDYGPEWPFVVGMVQTIAHRRLPEEVRRAFRTVIVDECNSAPCETVWGAVRRFYSRYVLGLTATPDRADGLTAAIPWIIGPTIARMERKFAADVHFLHMPWRECRIPKECSDGKVRKYKPVLKRFGRTNGIEAEKSLMRDEERLARLVGEAVRGYDEGRRPLIMVGLKDHAVLWAKALKARGFDPGFLVGGNDHSEMRKVPVIATYKKASKGVDFQPPPTLFIPAGPVRDIRQACGRALQPQAECRPLILHPVDWAPPLIKWALVCREYYVSKGFTLRNEVLAA